MLHSLPYCMRLGISRRLAAWAARAGDAGALPGLLPESWQYVSKLIISHKKSDFRIIILWPPNKTFNCKLHLFLNIQPKLSLKLILRFSQATLNHTGATHRATIVVSVRGDNKNWKDFVSHLYIMDQHFSRITHPDLDIPQNLDNLIQTGRACNEKYNEIDDLWER